MGFLALTECDQVHGGNRWGYRTLASSMGHFVLVGYASTAPFVPQARWREKDVGDATGLRSPPVGDDWGFKSTATGSMPSGHLMV